MTDEQKTHSDNVRAEYAAATAYHTALVVGRFTIAGLVSGGSAFLAAGVFKAEVSAVAKLFAATFAAWLTITAWLLELRTRALFRLIARRCVDIEHEEWMFTGAKWYDGFFSRQYKWVKPGSHESEGVPQGVDTVDVPTIFGFTLPHSLAKHVTYSKAFDLLYAGALAFWLIAAARWAVRAIRGS